MKTAVIINQTTLANENGRDALDLAMILGTFEQPVNLFFKGIGVMQLLPEQQTELALRKNYTNTFKALDLYDVEDVYCNEDDLAQFGLSADDLLIDIQVLSNQDYLKQLNQHQRHLSF